MAKTYLVCPHCGSDRLMSTEETTIDYPVVMTLDAMGSPKHTYTGSDRVVNDEGTRYAGNLYCRDCTAESTDGDLVTSAAYAHGEPNVISVDEATDRGAAIRWAAFCEAARSCTHHSYKCEWKSDWHHADTYVDEARRLNDEADRTNGTYTDPGQLAYEAAEAEGREHLKQYGVDDDRVDAPSDEDAGHGSPTQAEAPQGAEGAVSGRS